MYFPSSYSVPPPTGNVSGYDVTLEQSEDEEPQDEGDHPTPVGSPWDDDSNESINFWPSSLESEQGTSQQSLTPTSELISTSDHSRQSSSFSGQASIIAEAGSFRTRESRESESSRVQDEQDGDTFGK